MTAFLFILFNKSRSVFCLAIFCSSTVLAQQGFYIPASGSVYFTSDSSTIFSDVINYGRLGIAKNTVVNFSGQSWYNDALAMMPVSASGEGGWVRFYNEVHRQEVHAAYNAATRSGPAFYNIAIDNPYGLFLDNSGMRVQHLLRFNRGHVFLQGQTLTMGQGNPGIIEGYDDTRFFVTGTKGDGILLRENITRADGRVIFPVGTNARSYTPAAVRMISHAQDDFYFTVADSVWSQLISGNNMLRAGVNKTWRAGKRWRPGQDEADISLQHSLITEGIDFFLNKTKSYIAAYTGSYWDTAAFVAYPFASDLSSGGIMYGSGLNTRIMNGSIGTNSSFTKLALDARGLLKTNLVFNATRLDKDRVHVFWHTNPEFDIAYFVVQRRLIMETNFINRDTIYTKAVNGRSYEQLSYAVTDANAFGGMSFYRLQLVHGNGDISYSNIVPVGPLPGLYTTHLWPNPTPDVFYISIPPLVPAKLIVVWNVAGQKLMQEEVNGRSVVSMRGLLPGTYLVSIISNTNHIIETKKLVVTGK